ncbi:MAG TPA: response regulator [Pyrinomonadaceae bacterium]|nr:response regulator [Pyrinomonadaceae bacterium]
MVTGRKLLLADDSATIQKVVGLTFRDEGLEVITVGDGRQAVEMLEEVAPDIVLADIFMPGLNGYEVCEHIKRNERFRHIPVMLLVGSFEPFDEAEARRVGADDYLTKPFQSIRTLIGKVGNLLSGGSTTSSAEATTRKLTAPPPEAEKENRPDEEFIERSTADTAPLNPREHEELMQGRSNASREVSFADLSMDDQMIQATPAEDYSGSSQQQQPGARDARPQQQQQYARPTAQYSAADMKEAGITRNAEGARSTEREASQSAYAPAQAGESSTAAAAGQSSMASRAASRASVDDSLLDLGELEPPHAQAEADDFFLDLLDEAPAHGRSSSSAPSLNEAYEPRSEASAVAAPFAAPVVEPSTAAEDMDASARADYEEATAEATPQAHESASQAQGLGYGRGSGEEVRGEFGGGESEATPVAEAEPAAEVSLAQDAPQEFSADMQTAPTERLPEGFRVDSSPVDAGTAQGGEAAASVSPATGQITLSQISPEVIDAIARRVVEQMSARIVEQVAWEVVPDLAERLIRRRLDEENKQ